MRNLKKLLVLLATGVFVSVCVFNFILGSANYDKSLSSLLTLEALAFGETDSEKPFHCPNFKMKTDYFGQWPYLLTCCTNGTDSQTCPFPNEDKPKCAQHVIRNSHSNCKD
jgi:hypothetical protein